MSFWGAIKKAINSTIGTKDFLPLDEIISKSDSLVAPLKDSYSEYDDDVIYAIDVATVPDELNFQFTRSGSLWIRTYAYSLQPYTPTIKYYLNNALIKEYKGTGQSQIANDRFLLKVTMGDVLKMVFSEKELLQGAFSRRDITFSAVTTKTFGISEVNT